jgi:hypothetical protein
MDCLPSPPNGDANPPKPRARVNEATDGRRRTQ